MFRKWIIFAVLVLVVSLACNLSAVPVVMLDVYIEHDPNSAKLGSISSISVDWEGSESFFYANGDTAYIMRAVMIDNQKGWVIEP